MLFGMRGGMGASANAEASAKQRVLRDFRKIFPAWSHVELTHYWSGLVNLSRNGLPFVGEIPEHAGLFCSMCYHGNGVAMGSYCGHQAAKLMLKLSEPPQILNNPLTKFPFGAYRRLAIPAAYGSFALSDVL